MKLKLYCLFGLFVLFSYLMPFNIEHDRTSSNYKDNVLEPAEVLGDRGKQVKDVSKTYTLDAKQWNISIDGTKSVETTKGFNDALKWAREQGYTTFLVPRGTYLIDKDDSIDMVSEMTFLMEEGAIIQKESNGKEHYALLNIGPGIENVTLRGGTYRGDKDSHDYSRKDSSYTAGTHESGYGIITEAATNVTIDGVKIVNFTGDGLSIGATGSLIDEFYEQDFESGSINDKGLLISDTNKIRLTNLKVDHSLFDVQRNFQFLHGQNLPTTTYDVYFYKEDGTYILNKKNNTIGWGLVDIPEEASYFNVVFHAPYAKDIYLEYWVQAVSSNVVIKNSEFAFNRRQGITIGGATNVLIQNNIIHDMKGTMPQSGIDVEAGYALNNNIQIKENHFYNNTSYDVILFDGKNAVVEKNHFASKGAIGLAISEPFSGALIKDNTFEDSRIYAYRNSVFEGNKMIGGYASLFGPNLEVSGMTFIDAALNLNNSDPFGVTVSDVTIQNNKKAHSGLNVNGEAVHLKNITILGEPILRAMTGKGNDKSVYDNIQIIGYNSKYGLDLPRGTYNNCKMEAEQGYKGGLQLNDPGKYVFDNCSFKTNEQGGGGVSIYNEEAEVVIIDSSFEQLGDYTTIDVQSAKRVDVLNNTLVSNNMVRPDLAIISISNYWDREKPNDIHELVIRGNTIESNIAVNGISTIYGGMGAPPYIIEDNLLDNAKLELKNHDLNNNHKDIIK